LIVKYSSSEIKTQKIFSDFVSLIEKMDKGKE